MNHVSRTHAMGPQARGNAFHSVPHHRNIERAAYALDNKPWFHGLLETGTCKNPGSANHRKRSLNGLPQRWSGESGEMGEGGGGAGCRSHD